MLTVGLVRNMPNPRVVEMRRRLARIHDLAERAAEKAGERVVENMLDEWASGKLSTSELVSGLKRIIARDGRG